MKSLHNKLLFSIAVLLFAFSTTSCSTLDTANSTNRALTVMYGKTAPQDESFAEDPNCDTAAIQYEYRERGGMLGDDEGSVVSEFGLAFSHTGTTPWTLDPGESSKTLPVDVDSYEVTMGLRKEWYWGRFTPYVGAGIDLMLVEVDVNEDKHHDVTIGGYGKVGIRYSVTEQIALGTEVRYRSLDNLQIETEGHTTKGDMSGMMALVSLTWSF